MLSMLSALYCTLLSLLVYSFVLSPALRRSQLKWSGSRKEQPANQSAPCFLEDAGLRLGDHPFLTIPSHRYEPGFESRKSWASFVSCLLVVTVGMLKFPHPARLIRAMVLGSWVSRLKARSGMFRWERFRCKLKDSDDIFLELP